MSSREFSEWMAFARIEPIGETREDLRQAYLLAFLANITAARSHKPKEKPRVFKPEEFLPNFWEAVEEPETDALPERQAWQQQLQIVEMWNTVLGGKDTRQ